MCQHCCAGDAPFGLAEPQAAMLESYRAALLRGWSPDIVSDVSATLLAEIERDPVAFIGRRSDAANGEVAGRMVTLPDGHQVPRLPMRERWIWDGAFAGRISLRYTPGTNALNPHSLGHIGYTVVPWKQRRGYATRALAHMLGEARAVGLTAIEIVCEPDNRPSQQVILANGGRFVEEFTAEHYARPRKFRYAVDLT